MTTPDIERLPETMPGHYLTADGREMLTRYADLTRDQLCGGHLTDTEVAYNTAMLLRNDLGHEAVLTIAKDRIRWLSAQLALRDARLSALQAERDEAVNRKTNFERGASALVMVLHGAIREFLDAQHHWHNTHGTPVKYGANFGAINALQKVYDDTTIQASMWGEFIPSPDARALAAEARVAELEKERDGSKLFAAYYGAERGLSLAAESRATRLEWQRAKAVEALATVERLTGAWSEVDRLAAANQAMHTRALAAEARVAELEKEVALLKLRAEKLWRVARVGRNITIGRASPHGNAVLSPEQEVEGCYWTLIGCGPDEQQNALAEIIAHALNTPTQEPTDER